MVWTIPSPRPSDRRRHPSSLYTFPDMCETIVPLIGEEQAMTRAAGLLRGWVEAGMIASFAH